MITDLDPPPPRPRNDLRARLRPLVPRRLYRVGHEALNLAAALRWLPWREAIRLRRASGERERSLRLHPRNLLHPFLLATDPGARQSFADVVLRELYGVDVPMPEDPVIVDGGAHGGDSTTWLLSRYPAARVVAVEPAPRSHEILLANCAPYGDRVTVLRAGLWGEPGEVVLLDPGTSTGVTTVPRRANGACSSSAARCSGWR